MSNEDFRRGVLEVLLMVHRGQQDMRAEIRAEFLAIRGQIGQLQALAIDHAEELTTIRSRVIEQASRHGIEIHEHETALIKQDVRITKLERRFGHDSVPDAE